MLKSFGILYCLINLIFISACGGGNAGAPKDSGDTRSEQQTIEQRFTQGLEFIHKTIQEVHTTPSYKPERFNFYWQVEYQKAKDGLARLENEREGFLILKRFTCHSAPLLGINYYHKDLTTQCFQI